MNINPKNRNNITAADEKKHPLSEVGRPGRVTVVKLDGGSGFRRKITALGVLPGMPLTILRAARRGPVVVSVFGEQVMIGHGMAKRIYVRTTC